MIRFLASILSTIRFRRERFYPFSSPAVLQWSTVDRDNLKNFLKTPTGQRLLARYSQVHYTMLDAASDDNVRGQNFLYEARGFKSCISWLQSLSCSADVQAENAVGANQEKSLPDDFEALLAAQTSPT